MRTIQQQEREIKNIQEKIRRRKEKLIGEYLTNLQKHRLNREIHFLEGELMAEKFILGTMTHE